jgi:nucleoside phosphorylase
MGALMQLVAFLTRVVSVAMLISQAQWLWGSTVAFLYALDGDVAALQKAGAVEVRNFSVGGTVVRQLALDGHTVHAVRMGSGCVQTALAAQALLAKQKCDLVISVGPVGDIKGELETGRWYVINRVVAWQRGSRDDAGFRLHADARMAVARHPLLEGAGGVLAGMPGIGVASGEVFISCDSFRAELASLSGCAAVDMNLFGLLSVMESHGLGGIHLRTPSDRADSKAGGDFRRFTESYDGAGGRMAAEIIRSMPRDPTSPQAHDALRGMLKAADSREPRSRIPRSGTAKDVPADPAGVPGRSAD